MRYRSNNILALIPPKEEGKTILSFALFLNQVLGMRIFFYHIIEKPSLIDKIFHAKRARNERTETLEALRKFIAKHSSSDALKEITYRVKSGNPLNILTRQSKKGGYEFLLIAKSKEISNLDSDETDKLISRSYCPVMVVNQNYELKKIKKIIIPVDISQSTSKKLLWATYFAKKFGAEITIVSALAFNMETKKSLAWRNAEKLKHMLTQRGIKCNVEILKAFGKEKHAVILDYIEKENPGLVIIRTHQESNLAGTQIGKFVSEIVHGCQMPVFTVNRFMHPMPVDFDV